MTNVVHVVLITWKETALPSELEEIRAITRGLKEKIPGILHLQEGPSVSPEGLEDGFHYGINITFENAEARDNYLPHPRHQDLVEKLVAHCARVIVFDILAS